MEEIKEALEEKINNAETQEQLNEIEKEIEEVKEQQEEKVEEVTEEVSEVVEEKVEEKEVEEISTEEERSLLANAVSNEKIINKMEERKMENIYQTKEYRNAFLAKLQGKELNEEQRAAMSTAATSAGYAIPTTTLNAIEEVLKVESPLYNEVEILNIEGLLDVPAEKTLNDASWVEEGAVSTDSEDVLDKISFAARKLIKTVAITAEVEAMAIDAFEAWLVSRLGAKMAAAIDNAILNGRGATYHEPVGICADANVTTVNASIDYAGLTDTMSKLKFTNGAKVVMNSKTLWKKVANILDGSSRPVFMTSPVTGIDGKLFGLDVIVDDNCDDDTIVIGNFKKYIANFSKQIEIAKDGSVDFRYGNTVYRALALVDGHVINKNAFVVLKETVSA